MPIGKPFGRRPQQKSSKLYEDRIANAGKLPVEKPSLSPIASLMAFAVCLVAAGVFCITSGQVVVGIGVILFGMVPAVAMVAMAKQLVDKIVDGSAALVGPQASQESFGEDAERAFRLANKALSKQELSALEANRAEQSALTSEWYQTAREAFEDVSITSEDGIRLVGHLLTSPSESNQWLIYAHGLGGGWKNGLGIARHFSQRGYGVLMIEMRAQGESGGTIMGAGHLERRDLVEWCQQLVSRAGEDCRITLMGSSMGASAAIEASAEKDLPQQVKAIVSDSAYADFWNEAIFAMGSMGAQGKALPAHPLLDLARLMFRGRKGGYDIADASAVAAIAHSRVPVLLIHAEDDQLVPPFNAERLAEAAGGDAADDGHALLKIPSAGHCCAAMADPELYYQTVFGFLEIHDA